MDTDTLDLSTLSPAFRTALILALHSAIHMSDSGNSREEFLKMCVGAWEAVELNDREKLMRVMIECSMNDLNQEMSDHGFR